MKTRSAIVVVLACVFALGCREGQPYVRPAADADSTSGSRDAAQGNFDTNGEIPDSGCGKGENLCGSRCVNLATDRANCGVCSKDCALLPNVRAGAAVRCEAGACVVPADGCADGWAHCGERKDEYCETDITKPGACGGCGRSCTADKPICASVGNSQTCTATCGGMTPDQCTDKCVNLKSDPSNCGKCGQVCTLINADSTCVDGKCVQGPCKNGYADCSPSVPGCETALGTDTNCGKCGEVCSATNATTTCIDRACSVPLCNPGYANCDKSSPDCETKLGSAANCNACGGACSQPNPVCSSNGAQNMCVSDCGPSAPDKCVDQCVNFKSDATNCNGCGKKCSFDHAGAYCENATCKQGSCEQGWADCGGGPGCETQLGSNANCSRCGESCLFANATSTCTGTGCSAPVCNVNFGNCNSASPDCESNLLTNANHCGRCGHSCQGGECFGGACQPRALVTGYSLLEQIVVAGEFVVFGVRVPAMVETTIYAVKRDFSAAPVKLFNEPQGASALATDGNRAFWVTKNVLYYCSLPSCVGGRQKFVDGPQLDPGSNEIRQMIFEDGGMRFFVRVPAVYRGQSGSIWVSPMMSPTLTRFLGPPTILNPEDASIVKGTLYVADSGTYDANDRFNGDSAVLRVSLSSSEATKLVYGPQHGDLYRVTATANSVLWEEFGSPGIRSAPLPNGTGAGPSTSASDGDAYTRGALGDGDHFFAIRSAQGTATADIIQCQESGCRGAPRILATAQIGANTLRQDTSSLYWISDGGVVKVAK